TPRHFQKDSKVLTRSREGASSITWMCMCAFSAISRTPASFSGLLLGEGLKYRTISMRNIIAHFQNGMQIVCQKGM
ncbi:MAG: hypothetical protein J6N18_11655, partial [Kiritimatiellae bacterium]|nr:hypothetical protein [Kiritimatiellia bacterium]